MPNYGSTYTPLGGSPQPTGTTGSEALVNQLGSTVAPQLAQYGQQYQQAQNQLGLVGPELQQQLAYNNAMSGYQGQENQIAGQQIGLSQLANQQQGQQARTQQGFEEQQYGIQQGQFPEQQAEAALAYQNALRNTQGSQAISGTQNTVGGRADVSTLNQNYGFQQQDIARQQALSQLGQKSEESGFQYSQEQLQNASKSLALNAQSNGISQQQLLTLLNYGNTQAVQGAQQDVISLLAQMSGAALGEVGTAGQALSQVGFASGVNALSGIGNGR